MAEYLQSDETLQAMPLEFLLAEVLRGLRVGVQRLQAGDIPVDSTVISDLLVTISTESIDADEAYLDERSQASEDTDDDLDDRREHEVPVDGLPGPQPKPPTPKSVMESLTKRAICSPESSTKRTRIRPRYGALRTNGVPAESEAVSEEVLLQRAKMAIDTAIGKSWRTIHIGILAKIAFGDTRLAKSDFEAFIRTINADERLQHRGGNEYGPR